MEELQIGRAKLTWLNGGVNFMDGGAMFGVVPKPLWGKKYPYNEKNQIELRADPILLQLDGKNYVIDSGIGNHKFTSKQKRNFGILEELSIDQSLASVGLTTADIDEVLMTHLHFDHACGLTRPEGYTFVPVFENAAIHVSEVEWEEMRHPNIRSVNTYWEMNWKPVQHQVKTFREAQTITDGLQMIHTGGHSNGHVILVFDEGDEHFIHMADIMPTHAHQNKLWVLAYDDYPVTSVHQKEKWMNIGYKKNAWYTFYHDAYYRAIRFNDVGEKIDGVKRERYEYK